MLLRFVQSKYKIKTSSILGLICGVWVLADRGGGIEDAIWNGINILRYLPLEDCRLRPYVLHYPH